MPRVSVLLTCYNHLAYLPVALDSVKSQNYRDFEVIAIDDGSTDGTREWLAKHAGDAQVVFNEQNLGTYATLNRALEAASGEFVAILNDDDIWAPQKLELQVELMKRLPKVGLVHTNGGFIDGEGKPIEGSPLGFRFPRTESGQVLPDLLYQNKIIASAACVRRECFEKVGSFNPSFFGSGDWEMWLRIAERYEIGFVDEPLTFYRVHGANASHKLARIWQDDERLRLWIRSREPVYQQMGFDEKTLREALAHNEACLGTVYKLNGRVRESRSAYLRSIKLMPGRFKSYVRFLATFLPGGVFRKTLRKEN